MNNSDFSIQIQIGLQDQGKQLLTEWEKIKKTISDDKLTIKFTNNINESLKQITQMSNEINKLSLTVQSLNNTGKNVELINTNNLKYEIKGALTSLEEVRKVIKELGINNAVDINVNGIDKSTQEITKFIVKVKEAEGVLKDLTFTANRIDAGKIGEMNVTGYEGSVTKIKDTTSKLFQDLVNEDNKAQEKIQQAISQTIQKREQENRILQQNQNNAINKNLEQEAKERDLIQQKISETIAKREQEARKEAEIQAGYSNKALEKNYIQQQKLSEQETSRISGLGTNLGSFSSSGLSMSSNINEVDKYVKSVLGAKASVSSLIESEDKLGNSMKIANVSVNEGNNIYSKYKMALDESTQSAYLTSKSVEDLSSKHSTLSEQIGNALNGFLRFQLAAGGTMAVINSLKQGLQEIIDINKSNVNVAMITDDSVENVEKGNQALLKLAENLKVVNSEVLAGQESWMRSGVSQEEANKNLETTTKLSKIAGVANQEMADSLIVIKNAYDLNSTALEGYASKVSLLDNQSATSSQKINAAMQYSAQTFKSMGIDMNTALSWITNYSEKSAESGQAIGNHFKSLLENFHKLKAAYKSQDEDSVQSVNKIEDLLNSKGIALRKNKDEWNDLGTVVKQIQENIDQFTDVQKSDLAFKIGGKENAEATLATLNNMKRIDELNNKLKSDSGAKALNESYDKYKQGTEAQLANLKNSLTDFWQQTISSSTINSTISGLSNLVNTITSLTHNFGLIPTVITTASVALVAFNSNLKILNANNEINNNSKLVGMFNSIKSGLDNTSSSYRNHYNQLSLATQEYGKLTDVSNRAKAGMMTLGDGMNALANSEKIATVATTAFNAVIGLGIGVAISLAVEGIMKLINKISDTEQSITNLQSEMDTTKQNDQLISKYESLENQLGTLDKTSQEYKDTQNQIISIQKQLAQAFPSLVDGYTKEGDAIATNIEKLKQYNEQKKIQIMADAGKDYNTLKNDLTKSQTNGYVDAKVGSGDNYGSSIDKYNQYRKLMDDAINKGDNALASEYASKIKSVSSEIDKFNQASIQLYNVGMKDVEYFDTSSGKMVKYSDYLSDNTKKTNDNTQSKNANSDATENQAQSVENLNKSFKEATANIDVYSKYIKEMNENGGYLKADSIKEIIANHAELIPYLGNEKTLYNKIQEAIEDEKKTALKAYGDIIESSTEFYDANIKGTTKIQDALGDYYKNLSDKQKTDLANATTVAQAKEIVEMQVIADLEKAWADYFAQVDKELNNLGGLTGNDQTDDIRQMQAEKNASHTQAGQQSLDSAKKYNQQVADIEKRFNDLKNSFGSSLINQMDKTTEGENKLTKSTQENKVAQNALSDAIKEVQNQMKSYENTIKAVDNALYALDSQMQGMDQTSDEYINALKLQNSLFEQRISLVNSAKDANNSYVSSIGSMGGVGGSALGSQIVQEAEKYIGTKYVSGGESPSEGFDCSGLIQYVYKQFQIQLDRTTYTQINDGKSIAKNQVQPGDLVFFGDANSPHHVGIYVGNDQFIESPHTGANVRLSNLSSRSDYSAARRIISDSDFSATSSTNTTSSSTGITASQLDSVLKGALSGMGETFIKYGQEYGVSPALAASIAMHETGNGTSSAIRNQNNAGGMMGSNGLMTFSSLDAGIQAEIKNLKNNYIDDGLTTISAIQKKYAPIGASNDPTGLNNDWVSGVSGFYKQITGKTGSVDTVDLANSANSQIESILSKNEDYTKQNIDYARKIIENNTKIYEAYLGRYDEQLSHVDKNKEMAQTKYDLGKDNLSQSGMEESEKQSQQIWKEINWHYSVLNEKEKYITSQLYSNDYDNKTKSQMLKDLEEVRLQEAQTVQDLHKEFAIWQQEMYDISIKTNQTNIDELQRKYDILDKSSTKNYTDKININNEILGQEQEIYKTTVDRIDAVQKLISVEKDPESLQVWIDQENKLLQQLDEIKEKTIEIQQKNIQIAENDVLDTVQKAIYDGQTQTEYEDSINAQTQALDDQLEAMQKKSELLSEQETRQKNLLALAEAQIKLQDAQNEKSVQQLTKDKNGNWQFQYVANQQTVDDLEKNMRDQVQSNKDFETQTSQKHTEESINDEKKLLEEEVSIRSEAYSRIKENLEKAITDNKDKIIDGTITISSLIDTSLGGINTKYNGKYSSIISDLKSFIGNYTTDLTNFNATLQNSLSNISSASGSANSMTPGTGHSIYVTDLNSADAQIAKQYYSSLGYAIKQLDTAKAKNVASGDILLGAAGTYYTNNVSSTLPSGVTKLTGADRTATAALAQADSYAKQQQAIANAKIQAQQASITTSNVTVNSTNTNTTSSSGSSSSSSSSKVIQPTRTVYDAKTHSTTSYYYKKGGKNTETGWQWLDGTPEEPEYILNADQTDKMFNAIDILKDINLPSIQDMISKLPSLSNILPSISMPDISGIVSKASQTISNTVNLSSLTISCPNVVDGNSLMEVIHNLPNTITQTSNSNL